MISRHLKYRSLSLSVDDIRSYDVVSKVFYIILFLFYSNRNNQLLVTSTSNLLDLTGPKS